MTIPTIKKQEKTITENAPRKKDKKEKKKKTTHVHLSINTESSSTKATLGKRCQKEIQKKKEKKK